MLPTGLLPNSGDYEDFVYCDAELYAMLRPKTEKLIEAVVTLIEY